MELKPGYKQTEVGAIPEKWNLKRLGELASVSAGGTPSRTNPRYWNGDVPWVTTSELDSDTIKQARQCITTEGLKNSAARLLPPGTLLMAWYGQGKTRGKVGVLGISAATNQACAAISLNRNVSSEYIFQFLSNQYEAIRNLSNTGNQENLNGSIVRSLWISLPPEPEQRAIAAALSDVDALIGALDRLIAKKRDLKQSAVQQLLSGQCRLPGFNSEWGTKTLADLALPRRERVDPRKAGGQGFCVELEHIEQGTGRLLGSTSAGDQSSLKSTFEADDVLFGKLRAYLRKYWLADRPGVCSTEIWALVSNRQVVTPRFLLQLVKADPFIETASTAYGTHMPRSDWNLVKNLEVRLPPLEEQKAIATVLSDMDAEIAALERRRDKTRALKQGMMQELLTGRTRLV